MSRPRATVGATTKPSELSLRAFPEAQRAARIERCRCTLKLRNGEVALAGLG
jgi:hypothetical protein